MDMSTFSDPRIATYINANYYPIRFNAEYKDPIEFQGQTYKYEKGIKRGYHQLAAEICGNQLKLPTVVFLDVNGDVIQPIRGFQDVQTFEMIMTYFAENHNKTTPWRQFTINYRNNRESRGEIRFDSSHTRVVSNNQD
jgi:thioredoxin-related protein